MNAESRQTGDATESTTPDPTDPGYEKHLERSRTMWNRWSDWYTTSERDFEPIREAAIDRLGLESGDRVLEIGCGPGVNFALVREAIGETGRLVAVDYSPEMVAKARDRIERHGWDNVEVHCADATRVDIEGSFDAAVATLSMSIMPDVRAAVENVHRHLESGKSFVVFDLRPVPEGLARIANPFLRWFLRWYANWNPDGDVLASLRAVFTECTVVETYAAGTAYTVHCRKSVSPEE